MPLPCITKHGAKRCAALSKRTKLACGNPAAYGCKTCRYHGARKNILRGEQHPSYVHGNRTLEAERQSSASSLRLANLEDAMYALTTDDDCITITRTQTYRVQESSEY